jgi:hypothetical protein
MHISKFAYAALFLLIGIRSVSGAVLTVQNQIAAPTPDVAAYNLGHFFPQSNALAWWRYSGVSGARIFLNISHFNVNGSQRDGEELITDVSSFNARRAALRNDPLNVDYVNWPLIEQRFNTTLSGRNRIVPQYALNHIHQLGGTIKAQMSLGEGSFPIDDEDDWYGKWIAWRTYYSIAFYLARHFDVERYASHNEPNHTASLIAPEAWLMRLRLASDAARAAIEDVNSLYEKNLQLKFKAPVTAGSTSGPFVDYGKPAIESIRINYLGQFVENQPIFQHYAYQRYGLSPNNFANDFLNLKNEVQNITPADIPPFKFALTEFNVSTGANYDARTDSSDSLVNALRFGAITANLTTAGVDELYAFKFGMTGYEGNFPVQKNGMLFTDNDNAPYNYGTMGRSAEVYRLFVKGFAPGRHLLNHSLSGTNSQHLTVLVGENPANGFVYIFSVNESNNGVPLEIDLTAWNLANGSIAIIEDVSQWRSGTIRSLETVQGNLLTPGNQPARTVWLISIPTVGQQPMADNSMLLTLPIKQGTMVKDGIHAQTNLSTESVAYARNSPDSVDERAAVLFQFELPHQLDPDQILTAVLSLPIAPHQAADSSPAHAHLYGIDNHQWDASALTWANAPNLRQNVPAGNEIRHGIVSDAGYSAHVLGQISLTSAVTREIDVTDYLRSQPNGLASFLVTQDPRWNIDIQVEELPEDWDELVRGDTQPHGIRVHLNPSGSPTALKPELKLVLKQKPVLDYERWSRRFFDPRRLIDEPFTYPDGPLAGNGLWGRGPNSPQSDNPSNHIVISDNAVFFDWTTDQPLNNVVRWIWNAANLVTDQWLYASFDLEVTQAPLEATNARPGFLSFGDSSGNQHRGFVGLRKGNGNNAYQLGVSSSSQLANPFVFAPIDLDPLVRYRITLGFHAGNEDTALWIDSDFRKDAPDIYVTGNGSNTGIRRVILRLFNSDGDSGTTDLGQFLLDNLTIETNDTAASAPHAMASTDGLPNLLKFSLGLNPNQHAGLNAPGIRRDNDGSHYFQYPKSRIAEGFEVLLQSSEDLLNWETETGAEIWSDYGYGQIFRFPLNPIPSRDTFFLRLKVLEQTP